MNCIHFSSRMVDWTKEPLHDLNGGETISDFYTGPSWTAFCQDPQVGTSKPANVSSFAVAGALDGIQPFGRRSHSMWPLALTCMNFPPWLRNRLEAIHIPFIIPGNIHVVQFYVLI
jgi:hypothetical protein